MLPCGHSVDLHCLNEYLCSRTVKQLVPLSQQTQLHAPTGGIQVWECGSSECSSTFRTAQLGPGTRIFDSRNGLPVPAPLGTTSKSLFSLSRPFFNELHPFQLLSLALKDFHSRISALQSGDCYVSLDKPAHHVLLPFHPHTISQAHISLLTSRAQDAASD